MKDGRKIPVKLSRTLVSVGLVLVLLQGTVLAMFAQWPADLPPTWAPPQIYKYVDEARLGLNDSVEFSVTVKNLDEPPPSQVSVTWYDVRMTDVISPGLHIDLVSVTGSYDSYSTVDNTVVVSATTLAPGEWFAAAITCTVVGPVEGGQVLTNTASVVYEDDQGTPGGPDVSAPVTMTIVSRFFVPIVLRAY